MEEKRKSLRIDLQAELLVKRLDQEEEKKVSVNLYNISKEGVGFNCKEKLEIGAVYECVLILWTKEEIHTCIKIVRSHEEAGEWNYGGILIGMSETDARRIEIYQTVISNETNKPLD